MADDKKNSHISEKYGISSFPTIKFFSKGDKEPEDYDGDRTEDGLVAYLNEKCGTYRAVGGGLNNQVCFILSQMSAMVNWVYALRRQVATRS